MPLDLPIPSSPTLVLFVEDILTRAYLAEIWENPTDIAFLIGGGNEGVHSLVKLCENEGRWNVFGVTDCDFGVSNRLEWSNPTKTFRTFILPVHEIENCLLDAEALAASRYNNNRRDVPGIEQRMLKKANDLGWWLACCKTIHVLKQRIREPFPTNPSLAVDDETKAHDYICHSAWFQKLATEVGQSTVNDIRRLLADAHAAASAQLNDGSWRRDFSGKQIFEDAAFDICERLKLKVKKRPSRPVLLSDIAKGIARWQIENNRVPGDLRDLLAGLRGRIARPSRPA